jgi:DNA-binding HxlR family transcriptional regulator
MKALRKSYGCPVELSLDIIGGKWKAVILARLKRRSMRYGELRKAIPDLSEKVLTQRLHGLCEDGLVEMTPSAGGVSHYRLTETGASLRPVLQALYDWGAARSVVIGARIRSD